MTKLCTKCGIEKEVCEFGRRRIIVPVWCQRCGCVTELEAHHQDYSRPLSVEWLCSTCHGLAHRSYEGGQHAGL